MPFDTPPPDDELADGAAYGLDDDIEIIDDDDSDIEIAEGYLEEFPDGPNAVVSDFAETTFTGHTGSVFCCDLTKNSEYAVSGGQDDKAFIWNTRTGSIVSEFKGHKDSVCEGLFNFDSTLVATGDMSGCIQVRNSADFDTITWDYDIGEDLKFLQWHKKKNSLFAGAADGSCWLWELPDGRTVTNTQMFHSFGTPVACGQFMVDGVRVLVGYEDGTLRLWDHSANLLHSVQGRSAHSEAVTVTDCHPTENLILSGSSDGTVKLLKSTDCKVLFTISCEPADSEEKSVEGVAFFKNQPIFATGTVQGSLAIWDVATQVRRLQCEQESGITHLICDASRPMVYTAGVDGIIRLFDGRTGQEESFWTGHRSTILAFKLSSCGNIILTASDDHTCKIFETR